LNDTLLNPNLDPSGYSEDNFLQHELDMGASLALVRNSPKLVALNADARVNILSIYRAAGDGNFSTPAAQFVNERYSAAPQAAYLHLTNEAGLPPTIGAWTLECADAAERLGRKVVAFNAATNTDLALWKAQESAIRALVRRGHKIGLHLYLDGLHDAGGYAPLDWLHSIGADCFITEYGYIRSIKNDGEGYRGVLDDAQYADWLEAHAAKLAFYGWPAFLFSIDQWPNNDQGRAKGFGTEDRPNVLKHCKVINGKYPLGGTVTQPTTIPAPATGGVDGKLSKLPGDFVNLRDQPYASGRDVGDLHLGDVVVYYPDAPADGWLYVRPFTGMPGWVSLQAGAVAFTKLSLPLPDPAPEPMISIPLSTYNAMYAAAKLLVEGAKPPSSGGGF
jgi:hypothetical protein